VERPVADEGTLAAASRTRCVDGAAYRARAKTYLDAGADGAYIEGPETQEELRTISERLKGAALATSILERGGKTQWVSPAEMDTLGFGMILYPTTVLFGLVRSIEKSFAGLLLGQELDPVESVDMDQFEDIVNVGCWKNIEHHFMDVEHTSGPIGWLKHSVGQD